MSHFALLASFAILWVCCLASSWTTCTLHFFTLSTHGFRFTAEMPGVRASTGGPCRRALPIARACPPAICQSDWGSGAQTGESCWCKWFVFPRHFYFPFLFVSDIYIVANNPLFLATCSLTVPFQTTFNCHSYYFILCVFKMLFSETTNRSPLFKRGRNQLIHFVSLYKNFSIQKKSEKWWGECIESILQYNVWHLISVRYFQKKNSTISVPSE